MTEFDKLKGWLSAAAGAAVLAAIAFILTDLADPFGLFIVVIGFLLALAAAGVGIWALVKLGTWQRLSHQLKVLHRV
jgi:hypothetical protein